MANPGTFLSDLVHPGRRFFFLLANTIAFTAFSFNGSAQTSESGTGNETVSYFTQRIAGANPALNKKLASKLKPAGIDKARQEVWQAWKAANTVTDAGQLPAPEKDFEVIQKALAPAKDGQAVAPVHHSWKLPDEDPMPFYYFQKGAGGSANNYPLFINLHGSGPKKQEWPTVTKLANTYKDGPSLQFVPQIPSESRYRWWFKAEQYAWEKLFRLAMVSEEVNPDKIYFIGISEGGYGSQRLGAFYADYLAGAGPMAGGEPLVNAPVENYRNIAFAFETGENDRGFGRNTLTVRAKTVFDSMAKLNPGSFIHNINLQAGRGHGIDYSRVSPWLMKYDRNPYPAKISWVNFPMHNRYRSGFYNIAVLEQFNISDTAAVDRVKIELEMDKATNVINLSAHTLNNKTGEKGKVTKGKIAVYLAPELIDLSKKVKLYVDGKFVSNAKVNLSKSYLIESCALFGDPKRLYPAKVEVDFSNR